MGKKWKKPLRPATLCLLCSIWKEMNKRDFNDVEWFNQVIKSIFMYTFVNWVRVYIEDHRSLIDFIDWLFVR